MAQKHINTSAPNDNLGDTLRDANIKCEDNFTELYQNKVDKISGKGLSTNDYTTAEKTKLAGIPADAEKNVQADWLVNDTSSDAFIKNKPVIVSNVNWGDIAGDINNQSDLVNALANFPTYEYVDGKVSQTINSGITVYAPSEDTVFNALLLKEDLANKNIASGYAGLDPSGKIYSNQLPSIAISDTFVVASQVAMLALTGAQTGDIAVRTDISKSFILKGANYATLSDWQELLTPTDSVQSVFGRNGVVTANAGDYTTALVPDTTNKRYQTDNQNARNDATSSIQTQLDSKQENLLSGSNIKTVGGVSLLGSGNVTEVQNNLVASTALAPSTTAVNTALALKANLTGATFTGNLIAPEFVGDLTGNADTSQRVILTTVADANTSGTTGLSVLNNSTGSVNFPYIAGVTLDVKRANGSLSAVGNYQLFGTNNPSDNNLYFRTVSGYSGGEIWTGWRTIMQASGITNNYISKTTTNGLQVNSLLSDAGNDIVYQNVTYPFSSTTGGSAYLFNQSGSNGAGIGAIKQTFNTSDLVLFSQLGNNNSTEVARFKANGFVGIGTASPNYNLHVNAGAANNYMQFTNNSTGTGTTDGFILGVDMASAVQIFNRENTNVSFWTNNTRRMDLSAGGNLLINTTTDNGVDKLQVNGSVSAVAYNGGATLTGLPTAPTASAGTNTTQIATTAFVNNAVSGITNAVLLTGNQTKTGTLTFANPVGGGTALVLTNSGTASGQPIFRITNNNVNSVAASIVDTGAGGLAVTTSSANNPAIGISSTATGASATVLNMTATGNAIILSSQNPSSFTGGFAYYQVNNVTRFSVNNAGDLRATTIGKLSGTASEFLMADGSVKTEARPYKSYVTRLEQTGTTAPTATILENSIGAIVWTRTGVGTYRGTLSGAFLSGKTTVFINPAYGTGNVNAAQITTTSTIDVKTLSGATATDALLSTDLEIRVYL